MNETFENDRERLAALQAVDRRIKDKRDQIAVLTGEMDALGGALGQRRAECARLAAEREALDAQRRELEARLESEEEKIKGSRMRMTRVRNERELLALKHEVAVAKETNQQLEDQLIAIMERLEDLGSQLTTARQGLAEIETRAGTEMADRQARVDGLRGEIDAEREHRESLAAGLGGALRSKYEQLFERRGGMAVAEVRNGTCLGCRMHVPPQLFNELQKSNDVRQCPNCQRILYWRAEAVAAAVGQ